MGSTKTGLAGFGPQVVCYFTFLKLCRDFPGGPVVKNLPSNAGDAGSIPGRGNKIPHAAGQLSLCATARMSPCAATREPTCRNEKIPQATTKT